MCLSSLSCNAFQNHHGSKKQFLRQSKFCIPWQVGIKENGPEWRWNIRVWYNKIAQTTHHGIPVCAPRPPPVWGLAKFVVHTNKRTNWTSLSGSSNDGAPNQTVTLLGLCRLAHLQRERRHRHDLDCVSLWPPVTSVFIGLVSFLCCVQ